MSILPSLCKMNLYWLHYIKNVGSQQQQQKHLNFGISKIQRVVSCLGGNITILCFVGLLNKPRYNLAGVQAETLPQCLLYNTIQYNNTTYDSVQCSDPQIEVRLILFEAWGQVYCNALKLTDSHKEGIREVQNMKLQKSIILKCMAIISTRRDFMIYRLRANWILCQWTLSWPGF